MAKQTLTKLEASVLASFLFHVNNLQQNFGEEAKVIRIDYDRETDDFDIVTNKQDKRKKRLSKIEADIVQWANQQLDTIKFTHQTELNKLLLEYQNEQYSIEIDVYTENSSDEHYHAET